ncbi:gsk3-beta interaction protein-like [Plakobranchus ocellatus]|uniref:Gsk3-beta interaction protein-like n=1 Tax=Plakobranchus ocellatus TaxID=259542 RepID=A0AAV4AJ63_9GAST|nr:gsk3-beta interaction protein-like [Plakobranchus ocellatus]
MADAIDSDMIDDDRALTIEASAVVREIAYAVKFVEISNIFPATTNLVYINLTTKENQHMCVELSLQGFRVVAMEYNKINPEFISRHYETIYSLLDSRSEEYRSTFCETLSNKLLHLQQLSHSTAADEDFSDDQMDTK